MHRKMYLLSPVCLRLLQSLQGNPDIYNFNEKSHNFKNNFLIYYKGYCQKNYDVVLFYRNDDNIYQIF